ncbi:hypothetical protein [Mucilaginibacter myungsuensis]|uniref:Uncharacterized protein n=1 Tax=Mucilaginibacter myungsuensis TaxID=649104 RepID=A0A929PWV7_9SPHI|nr:hypothetical protein [Mucilaginibacter myungsuensis]MBE9661582.1 hypothetical protein [Mucilaginibacter myungsuensis]MDN3597725.1 hypothetical protein [Mucilaginibacter myungsuensis]
MTCNNTGWRGSNEQGEADRIKIVTLKTRSLCSKIPIIGTLNSLTTIKGRCPDQQRH